MHINQEIPSKVQLLRSACGMRNPDANSLALFARNIFQEAIDELADEEQDASLRAFSQQEVDNLMEASGEDGAEGIIMDDSRQRAIRDHIDCSSVLKKRRKKMRRHKHKKRLRKNRYKTRK